MTGKIGRSQYYGEKPIKKSFVASHLFKSSRPHEDIIVVCYGTLKTETKAQTGRSWVKESV